MKALAVNLRPVIRVSRGICALGVQYPLCDTSATETLGQETMFRGTVVAKSHLSPSDVSTGHRTGHHNRSSDNLDNHVFTAQQSSPIFDITVVPLNGN